MPRQANQRAAPLPEIDETLLAQLRIHRVLTTAQAADATGLAVRTASRRLARLRSAGYTDYIQPGAAKGTNPFHWWLTDAGHRHLLSSTRVDPEGLPLPVIHHAAATSAVPLALTKVGPPLHLASWTRDYYAWHYWQSSDRRRRLTPDGLAVLRVDGHDTPLPVLVEVDLRTMVRRQLLGKINTYLWYATDRGWREHHDQCPVLLFLTTGPERAGNVLALVQGALERHPYSSATAQLVIAVAPTVRHPRASVDDPVWQTTPGGPAQTLTELLCACLDHRARNPLNCPR
jgi:hypothetical protein